MDMTKYHWVCSYDICHPKRLRQVHQLLSMLGIALNYSVFYLSLTAAQFKQLCQKLNKLIPASDDVRLYKCTSLSSIRLIGELTPEGIALINAKGVVF